MVTLASDRVPSYRRRDALALCAGILALRATSAFGAAPTFDLAPLRGKVVYLDFWASWCEACQLSFPFMEKLRALYPQADFALVAVNVDKERAKAEAFLRRMEVNFSIVYDPAGALAAQFKIPTMPTSLVIDRAGKTRFVHPGFYPEKQSEYLQHVEGLLYDKR